MSLHVCLHRRRAVMDFTLLNNMPLSKWRVITALAGALSFAFVLCPRR